MFEDQKGCCGICKRHQSEFKKRLGVDHNHSTGKIRKLLCDRCNLGLGFYELFKDEYKTYLSQHDKT
jgi:hypothetical protein